MNNLLCPYMLNRHQEYDVKYIEIRTSYAYECQEYNIDISSTYSNLGAYL